MFDLPVPLSITLCYTIFFLKYTNDEYDHFYVFVAAESESDIHFTSSHLDLAVLELWIFAFLLKSEKIFERKLSTTITLMFFYVFFDEESEKSIRNTLSCLLFEFSFMSQKYFFENKKYQKIKK